MSDEPRDQPDEPDDVQNTEEAFALEAGLGGDTADFPEAPNEKSAADDVPELDPELKAALDEVGGGSTAEPPAEPEPDEPEPPSETELPETHGDTIVYDALEAEDADEPAAEAGEDDEEPDPDDDSTAEAELEVVPALDEVDDPDPELDEERELDEEPEAEDELEAEEEPAEADDGPETAEHPTASVAPPTGVGPPPGATAPSGAEEVREAITAATIAGEPFAPQLPPAAGDPEPPPKRPRMLLRFLLASVVIIASFAGATSAVGVLRLQEIVDDIQPIPGVQDKLAQVHAGDPETFLILGSDKRIANDPEGKGLSDTTILLRVDADSNVISLMNVPRDLKVEIPGYGTSKFNAAYAYGGPKLTLRTLKYLFRGSDLKINHLVNIDFLGFAQAINAINCVYIDVDRDYYHSNIGLPASLQYDEIDIDAGYQKLCGSDALDYVRYRHTDTDLVRAARQQDFLREARQRVPPSKLLKDQDELINIFTSHTSSDIQDVGTMIEVLKLMIGARGAPINEVHFPAVLGPSYVTASRHDVLSAMDQFLGFEGSGGPRGALDTPQNAPEASSATGSTGATGSDNVLNPSQSTGSAGPKQKPKPKEKAKPPPEVEDTPEPGSDGLVNAADGALEQAKVVAKKVEHGFPVFYSKRVPPGSIYAQEPRVYHINDTSGDTHTAYRFVLQLPEGDYFGIQGIKGWDDPPILNKPSETRDINGREADIYLSDDRIRLIAVHRGDSSYWISNSLLNTLTNDQMLGMARSFKTLIPNEKPKLKKRNKKKKG